MSGFRFWRRFRRRSAAALRTTFEALQQEPHPLRTASRLVRAAILHRMKPQDTLLYDLDCRPVADARGFLTKRSHTLLQDVLNPPIHHHLVLNKLDYHVACRARGVAAPPVLAVVDFGPDDGRCATLNTFRITGEADMARFLGSLPGPTRLVFKSLLGSYGHGFLGLTVDAEGAVDTDGRRLDPAAVLQHCDAHRADAGFLVQAWLDPDPALRPLMPGRALGTVRVVTLLVGDQVRFPFAFVKIPVGTSVYDAFHHGQTGNLLASVDVVDGSVGIAWGPSPTRRHRLETYSAHPDNGVAIEGFPIPRWQEVLRVATYGARAFPELKTVGWDVAITPGEIFLLEGNHHWDPQVPQVLLRRGFRPDMEALIAQAGCRASAS